METFKEFKVLIYLLLISGTVIFALVFTSGSKEEKIPVTSTPEYRALEKEKDEWKSKYGISEFARTQLDMDAQEHLSKEQVIYNNQSSRQNKIKKMTPSQTDELFKKLVRVE